MLDMNPITLSAVVDQALQDAAQHPRWVNAINRAVAELVSNPYIERQQGHSGLLIGSPSGNAYASNGICGCTAYTGIDANTGRRLHLGGQPCWHRAAARLVRLHDERGARIGRLVAETGCSARAAAAAVAETEKQIAEPGRVASQIAAAKRAAYERAVAELDECFA
jgi:hypothetical protein